MDVKEKVEAYIAKNEKFAKGLTKIRKVLLKAGQEETVKWGMPTYTIDGKNVTGIGAFKNHFGVWFFQGGLLKDAHKKLMNAQEGKTAAMRQWRFDSEAEIDVKLLTAYVKEAIENQRAGRMIKSKPPVKKAPSKMPALMATHLAKNTEVEKAFRSLTPGKQKEYIEYIVDAKRDETKLSRLKKISAMILEGKGLNDRYKSK